MRTIKFRAWDKKEKKMHNPIYIITPSGHWEVGKTIVESINPKYATTGDLNPLEIMQYTGLKDKNGKEIYEGDIGNYTYYPADVELGTHTVIEEVSFSRGAFGIKRGDDTLSFEGTMDTEEDFEVIGNIYENKEALK